jgi:hypothetical protein
MRLWWAPLVTPEPCPPFPQPHFTLTQPWATVGAAVIAVIAAGIAYAGVVKTVRSTRRENIRKEEADVLGEGLAAVQDLARTMMRIGITTNPANRAELIRTLNAGPMEELHAAVSLAAGKLMLYGFKDVQNETNPTTMMLQNLWELVRKQPNTEIDIADIEMNLKASAIAFRKEFSKLR